MVYKNVSGQALHIGGRIILPFEIFEVNEAEEVKAIEKALKEGLVIEQITEVNPVRENQINE